ncbi:MAG TPA: helix-turn-helix domain-containing protein [Polyangiales bacterium]|nr:helix-turn-helix domain-containing protein [Polyangiales bacterium]
MGVGFGQFCPVAIACEVFARRWTPLILRELFSGAEHFNEIQRGLPLLSRSLLARRLKELEAAGVVVVETKESGRGRRYRLTDAGKEFGPVIDGLGNWGQRWTLRVNPENLDPSWLMWNMRRRIARDRLPASRVVVRLKFTGVPTTYRGPRLFWLILEREAVDLCIDDPGIEIDLNVGADLTAMAKVWLGDSAFESALRAGQVQLTGPPHLADAFPSWLLLSRFARVSRPLIADSGSTRQR